MWNPFARTSSAGIKTPDKRRNTTAQSARTLHGSENNVVGSEIAQIDIIGGTAVVTLTIEELSSQQGAAMLADVLDQVVESGANHIVIDIQNVIFMDSACIGTLVEALNRLAASGGRIALVNPASSVANIFRITRLDRVFPICSDVLAAIDIVEQRNKEK